MPGSQEEKAIKTTSMRLSARCHEDLAYISQAYGLTKSASIALAISLTRKAMDDAIENVSREIAKKWSKGGSTL